MALDFNRDFRRMSPEQIVDLFIPHNLQVDIEKVARLAKRLFTAPHEERERIVKVLENYRQRVFNHVLSTDKPFLEAPEQRQDGQIILGKVFQGDLEAYEYSLPVTELTHTYTGGVSGGGKSTFNWQVMKQLVEKKCNVLVFDRKRDMRYLLNQMPLVVLNAKTQLRINIFEAPPGVDQHSWLGKVADLFYTFKILIASRNYIKDFMISLYKELGRVPTIFDVYYAIKGRRENTDTEKEYSAVVKNKLSNIVDELGPMLSCERSFPLDRLLKLPLVIEVDRLSIQSERFLVAWFLTAILEMHMAADTRGDPAMDSESLFVFFDEAGRMFNAALDSSHMVQEVSNDIIQDMAMVCRDYKVCLFFSSQRGLSANVLGNCRTKVLTSFPDAEDAFMMSKSVGVDQKVFRRLTRGEFVVKTGGISPFLIRTAPIERELISQEQLDELMKPFADAIIEGCVPLDSGEASERSYIRLDKDSKAFLLNVVQFPSLTATQRYQALELKGEAAQRIKNFLIEKKVLIQVELPTGDTGKKSTFFVPTKEGMEYARQISDSLPNWYRHIGSVTPAHQLIQAMIIEQLSGMGFKVQNDIPVADKHADIYCEKDGIKAIVEVAVHTAIDVERVRSALTLVDRFVVVAADGMILGLMAGALDQLGSDKISFHLASHALGELRKKRAGFILYNNKHTQNNQKKQDSDSSGREQPENSSSGRHDTRKGGPTE